MSAKIRSCRHCGCTDTQACAGGCWWVGADLCSSCAKVPKERPILFSGPMVEALIDGRKTQTRRALKPQPQLGEYSATGHEGAPWWAWICNPGSNARERAFYWADGQPAQIEGACPYGRPGERLWVREAWARSHVYQAGEEWFVYRAADNRTDYGGPWKPSIHMPRAACRLVLEVTEVRVQRLQDISEDNAIAEGIDGTMAAELATSSPWADHVAPVAVHAYAALWDSINGAGAWLANPWVWAVNFRRVQP